MRVQTRKTAYGTEYWDMKSKSTVFVPVGKKPSFEVTENPRSMIMGVDLASDKDMIAINDETHSEAPETTFDDMTISELRAYAKENSLQIPNKITKQADIAAYLNEVTLSQGTEDDAE